ncbi:hypothetical protein ACH5RR_001239 [Cinchona calisaya]|uniref:Uncharacterized protein n=1 Tax=Cinchona calisaya TaxID=153742 RepID=A0ABD3B3M9_9GENT
MASSRSTIRVSSILGLNSSQLEPRSLLVNLEGGIEVALSNASEFPPLTSSRHQEFVQSFSKSLAQVARATHGGMALKFLPPEWNSPIRMLQEDVVPGLEKWKHAVLGFMVGYSFPFYVEKQFFDTRWKLFGSVELTSLKNGVFILNFGDAEHNI